MGILNVGAGDTKLVFDNKNPDELAKSAAIVRDMIRRGFALFIEVGHNEKGPIYQRAHDFDEATAEYIVVGPSQEQEESNEQITAIPPPRSRKGTSRRIPAVQASGVAVARIAGG
jgi:hypothetical protein